MTGRVVVGFALPAALGFAVGTALHEGPSVQRSAVSSAGRGDSITQVVTARQQELAAALGSRERARVDALIAEDFVAINAAAKVLDKAGALAELGHLGYDLLSVEDDSIQVRSFDDCAVVTARETVRARAEGREQTGHLRLTNIWVKENSGWRTVGGQATMLP